MALDPVETLPELIAAYGKGNTTLAVGDRALYLSKGKFDELKINLCEVIEDYPGSWHKEPSVHVRMLRTFSSDGTSQPPARFDYANRIVAAKYFAKPIGEHLIAKARYWERAAGRARAWADQLKGSVES